MTGWTAFAHGLATELAAAPDTTVLVIGESAAPGARRFAQFRKTGTAVAAELTGDEWLEPAFRPDADGIRAITEAGWQTPDEAHMDNWWAEFPWPTTTEDYQRLAAMTVTGLRDGFGIAAPTTLVYRGWVEQAGNSDLHLPGLGIPDAP
ncbi:TY-Chap domain-containing protein [Nocardia sp. SSK8]|uniref:TY-Chap domain-containing protein n=1 Tax=Nocardia sp. SSK8 TaxID=3120154 RepID=UPI003008E303